MVNKYKNTAQSQLYLGLFILLFSCNNPFGNQEDAISFNESNSKNSYTKIQIQNLLSSAIENNGRMNDSIQLPYVEPVEDHYYNNEYNPIWSDTGVWKPFAVDLMNYLDTIELDGLYKKDYHYNGIKNLHSILKKDTGNTFDSANWAKADLLLTDAFMHIISDIKQGRLQSDSFSWKHDTTKYARFFSENLNSLIKGKRLSEIITSLQPVHQGYVLLKKGIKNFLKNMDTSSYTYISYPYDTNNAEDSLRFFKQLKTRLVEEGILKSTKDNAIDSLALSKAISIYQKKKNLIADGKLSSMLIRSFNLTDQLRFQRIAITLDRYKLLPEKMPPQYIWVNLPAFNLVVWANDTIAFSSKIICGKPFTPTPVLTSDVSDMIIYPTWTVPFSIVRKEMLPGLKRNAHYLNRKGLKLYKNNGTLVNPDSVDWTKYAKGIPFKIQQSSGDGNALGVIKFNFENEYAVYLHDTNQRYLFNNKFRALSHGCVRVEKWKELAYFISKNDSIHISPGQVPSYNVDSINHWISMKSRHKITVKNRLPVFIRYFSCEGENDGIKFHEDIYDEDKKMSALYFTSK